MPWKNINSGRGYQNPHVQLLVLLISAIFCTMIQSREIPNKCGSCVDSEGNSCDDVMKRFGKTKYWHPLHFRGTLWPQAYVTCSTYGMVMAEINDEADESDFLKFALKTGFGNFWTGTVLTADGWRKPDLITPVRYRYKGLKAMAMPAEPNFEEVVAYGRFVRSFDFARDPIGIACQYPDSFKCSNRSSGPRPPSHIDAKCPEPTFGTGNQLIRSGAGSKYLFPKVPYMTSVNSAKRLCKSMGLEIASVETRRQWMVLQKSVEDGEVKPKTALLPRSPMVYMSLSGVSKEGEINYKDDNTGQLIKFQQFDLTRSYASPAEKCLIVRCDYTCYTFMRNCELPNSVIPLCQYGKSSACPFVEVDPITSFEGSYSFKRLGSIGAQKDKNRLREYFISREQSNYENGKKLCKTIDAKLLAFRKGDLDENTAALRFLVGLKENPEFMREYPSGSVNFWLRGHIANPGFIDDGSGVVWGEADVARNLHFGRILYEKMQDAEREKCLVIVETGIRPVSCMLPNYVVCYKGRDVEDKKKNHTATAPVANLTGAGRSMGQPADNDTLEGRCKGQVDFKIDFDNEGYTKDKVINFMQLAVKFNFSKGFSNALAIKQESEWRINHVKNMAKITKKVCGSQYISPRYIGTLVNLIMIYYNSKAERELPDENQEAWARISMGYHTCINQSVPLTLKGNGGVVTAFEMKDVGGGGTVTDESILIVKERADAIRQMDFVMEGLWYMFEVVAGSCYGFTSGSRSSWLSEYFNTFREDFTEQFKQLWVKPNQQMNYGLLFGDVDLFTNLYNLRACAVATFSRLGILDRLPVRPVNVANTNGLRSDWNSRIE